MHSDHTFLLAKLKVRTKKGIKRVKVSKIDMELLNQNNVKKMANKIKSVLEHICNTNTEGNIDKKWEKMKGIFVFTKISK